MYDSVFSGAVRSLSAADNNSRPSYYIFLIVFAAGLNQIQTNLAENKIKSNELRVCPSIHLQKLKGD